jgi:hypothetical protein
MGGHSKGSSFEREICKLLSSWWSDGQRDDIFWRTSGSGARATVRQKIGKKTYGQEGDIQAVDPIGSPLTKLFTIELKRGYSKNTILDIIDAPKKAKPQIYEQFIIQSMTEQANSGTWAWCLITKRNSKETMIFMPHYSFVTFTKDTQKALGFSRVEILMYFKKPYFWNTKSGIRKEEIKERVIGLKLKDFLRWVSPKDIKQIYKQYKAIKND